MNRTGLQYRLPAQHLLSAALSAALASCTAQSLRKIATGGVPDEKPQAVEVLPHAQSRLNAKDLTI